MKYMNEAYRIHQYQFIKTYMINIKIGFYSVCPRIDFFNSLMIELQLSEDFAPNLNENFYFGIFEQNDSFNHKHAMLDNPLAMYCYAHCVSSVVDAIYWLEESARYELGISYNEPNYLYYVYKHDLAKTWLIMIFFKKTVHWKCHF